MMDLEKFQKLRTYDLVLLTLRLPDGPQPKRAVWANRLDALRTAIGGALNPNGPFPVTELQDHHVVCRVEKPVAQTQPPDEVYAITATLRSIDALPPDRVITFDLDGKPVPFQITREFLSPDYRDPRESLIWNPGNKDERAITDPFGFIGQDCDWQWLPTHGDHPISVRDRLGRGTAEGINNDPMRALLEYRAWVTQRLLEQVGQAAAVYAASRRTQYALSKRVDAERAALFASRITAFGGDIPGSTELTSDIDINTFGDGTEFAVKNFNALFRSLFAGNEPGIVFDVNIYGKDFLPRFEPKEAWKRKKAGNPPQVEPEVQIRPIFDHDFTSHETEKRDALRQLAHGFIKLRRYMVDTGTPLDEGSPESSWNAFCGYYRDKPAPGQTHRVMPLLTVARNQHLVRNHLVYTVATARAGALVADAFSHLLVYDNALEARYADSERLLRAIDRTTLMAAQNALYEHALAHHVEDARLELSMLQFRRSEISGPAPASLVHLLDRAYLRLRQDISSSLYFANEAYATAGGVLQVVGGKQQKSRKVGVDYGKKQSFHNIAYTAHELMQSAVDQLADIHKEAHRHFAEDPTDLGGTMLATGKYIHRLFNALKHLYALMQRITVTDADGIRHDFKAAFPRPLVDDDDTWMTIRRFGYGLEGLKKAPRWPSAADCDAFVGDWNRRMQTKDVNVPFLLAVKFGLDQNQLPACVQSATQANPRNPKAAAVEWLVDNLPIRINVTIGGETFAIKPSTMRPARAALVQRNYYRYFNAFVQRAIDDYYDYLNVAEDDLKRSFNRQRPPYFWAGRPDVPRSFDNWELDIEEDDPDAGDE
jgi:hypothetical protein